MLLSNTINLVGYWFFITFAQNFSITLCFICDMRQFFFFFFLSLTTLSYGFINKHDPIFFIKLPFTIDKLSVVPIPRDTLPDIEPPTTGVGDIEESVYDIICYKNYEATELYILPNFSQEDVEIVVFERVRGVVFTGTVDLLSGQLTNIDTPWGQGVYTIIFKVSDKLILRGDFVIL